ncbi:MAG: type VI secretion system baseplate subunit TssE [Phycisphaeraceae bacterium]
MPELTPTDRLQPSLLDRLTDDQPGQRQESREHRVLSMRKLRAAVVRDLSWLLNTGQLAAVRDLGPYPFVQSSVLNYGCPEFSGVTGSSIDVSQLEREIREAILWFEPRLIPSTVRVNAVVREDELSQRLLTLDIEGSLWAQPVPEQLLLRTELDLETGEVNVEEQGHG